MLVVVDIDGTIADWTERASKAGHQPNRENQHEFQEWLNRLQSDEELIKDSPVPAMQLLLNSLYYVGDRIVYLTGRCAKYYDVTSKWLVRNNFPTGMLLMRENNDWRSAKDYKAYQIAQITEICGRMPDLVIDDDHENDCSTMYRSSGICHLKAMGDK